MYIIGNADTARPVQMWSEVLTLLGREGNIGDAIELRCPRHQGKQITVRKPEDFLLYAPDGGCEVLCGKRLDDCGHICPEYCHSKALHQAVICPEECLRKLPGCNHPCGTICGKRCQECIVNIPRVLLPCGHLCYNIPCHQAQSPDGITCMTIVVKTIPGCGHEQSEPCSVDITDPEYICVALCELVLKCGHTSYNIACYQTRTPEEVLCSRSVTKTVQGCGHTKNVACHFDLTNPEYKCDTTCEEMLACGHACRARCWECRQERLQGENLHVPCRSSCGRLHVPCGHPCTKPCHPGLECGACDSQCEFGCPHSRCLKGCGEPCVPCILPCKSSCNHRGKCKMPCAHPCNILPCEKRCMKRLSCGHQCPSLCGEPCPEPYFCQRCATPAVRSQVVDPYRQTKYEKTDLNSNPVIFPPCGHFLTVQVLDGLMRMEEVYEYQGGNIIRQRPQEEWINDPERIQMKCSECTQPLIASTNRYSRISKSATMAVLTNRLITDTSKQFLSLEQQVTQMEYQLDNTRIRFADNVNAAFMQSTAAGIEGIPISPMPSMITERHKGIYQLAQTIQKVITSTAEREQPFLSLYAQVSQTTPRPGNRHTTSASTIDNLSVNPRHRLLGQLLYLRLEWARIMDILKVTRLDGLQWHQTDIRRLAQSITLLLPKLQSDCKRLEGDTSAAFQCAQYIEAKLFHARFVALELALPPRSFRLIPRDEKLPSSARIEEENRVYTTTKLSREITSLKEALGICIQQPTATRGLRAIVEQGLQILPAGSVFQERAVTIEQEMLYTTMRGREWTETIHLTFCMNRHPVSLRIHPYYNVFYYIKAWFENS